MKIKKSIEYNGKITNYFSNKSLSEENGLGSGGNGANGGVESKRRENDEVYTPRDPRTAPNLTTVMKACSGKPKTKLKGAKSGRRKGKLTGQKGTVSSQLGILKYFGRISLDWNKEKGRLNSHGNYTTLIKPS